MRLKPSEAKLASWHEDKGDRCESIQKFVDQGLGLGPKPLFSFRISCLQPKDAIGSFTGKEDYKFGDITKTLLRQRRAVIMHVAA